MTSSANTYQALLVSCADQLIALPLMRITEITEITSITQIPLTSPVIVGLSQLRGAALTVIDTAFMLKLREQQLSVQTDREHILEQVCLVLEVDDWRVGLLVDKVHHTFHTSESIINDFDPQSQQAQVFSGSIAVPNFEQRALLAPQHHLIRQLADARQWSA